MTVLILVGKEGKKNDNIPQKVFVIHDIIGKQVGVIDHCKRITLLSDWKILLYNLDKVTYFPRRKIPRVYLIQTLPSLDLPGDSQFSP